MKKDKKNDGKETAHVAQRKPVLHLAKITAVMTVDEIQVVVAKMVDAIIGVREGDSVQGTDEGGLTIKDRAALTARLENYIDEKYDALLAKDKCLVGVVFKGDLVLDVLTVIPKERKEEALKRACDAKQISILNLDTGEEVKTAYGVSLDKKKRKKGF